jgi:hypothetical protein
MATSKIVFTPDQMAFVTNATKAIVGVLSTEAKAKSDLASIKEQAKKAVAQHLVELNLNLKALKVAKVKLFQGTMRSNPAIEALFNAFVEGGQSKGTAKNSVAVVKACYNGDVGGPHKFPNGLEVPEFSLDRVTKKRKAYKGLLDGKEVLVDRGATSCAPALIKAMEGAGFEGVVRGFIKSLGADPRKFTAEEITVGFQTALTEAKLAVLKDGKVTAK